MEEQKSKDSGGLFFIEQSIWTKMIAHCQSEQPMEACGLLSGTGGHAETIWMMENVENSPTAFAMDMEQIRRVFRQIEEKGERLVGIYHSHPTAPPVPSSRDIEFANYPEAAYIIVSLAKRIPEIGIYHILEKRVTPILFYIV
ncbi:Mov34/MPN/PAD-1 family protein [Ammoniphilus sp. YIM 78166]|uniref:Mov34/MPN/PAD-1 family protein n=1 Tax=Ammoniphilus sp. YIM 78166 TaxID=1644106 RepID=UPI001F0E88E4|nr:M67 family metallopeptidase [Ammoniphilus sp. YIM 78166]